MSDKPRGRARGRAKGHDQAAQAPQARRPGGDGPPQHRPPGLPMQQGRPAGPTPQQYAQRAPAPQTLAQQIGGRAVHRRPDSGDVAGAAAKLEGLVVSAGGDGGTGPSSAGRGALRGRRPIENVLHTRPVTAGSKKGASGTPVRLTTNYFQIVTYPNWSLYQYHVDISPTEDITARRKALMRVGGRSVFTSGYIYDGTVLFTSVRLAKEVTEVVAEADNGEKYTLTIRLVGDLAFGDYHYLQLFNILIKRCLNGLKLQLVGRNFFDAKAKIAVPEHQLEMWPGYITSIRQHETNILMCVEVVHKVMRMDNVLNVLQRCITDSRGGDYKKQFQQEVIGSIVLTDYNNRTYRIDDIDWSTSPSSTFEKKDNTRISYRDYFAQRYNLRIRESNQPMLVSRAKPREIRSGMSELVYLVPELCRMTGLTDRQRSNFNLMKALAEHTRVAPGNRVKKLIEFSRRLKNEPAVAKDLKEWDLDLADRLMDLTGRILPQENILLGGTRVPSERDCDWTKHLRSIPMFSNAQLQNWVVVFPRYMESTVGGFMPLIVRAANGLGFTIAPPRRMEIENDRTASYLEGIDSCMRKQPTPQIIVCCLDRGTSDRYGAIKKRCCVELGIPSQVIVKKNLEKRNMSVATKVAIQINCKLGGAPWTVEIPLSDLMIVGFDVCHDTLKKEKSYGAMVATLEKNCTRYFSTVAAHRNGEELSNHFGLNIVKAVQKYKAVNGKYPARIMIFRDGVGEGQLSHVFNFEVEMIRKTLTENFYKEGNLKMAFIVVSKRINTRFFSNDGTGKFGNPPPGTAVDDVVTLPERYDYFIVSQCVRQGTVSPTSYNVLYDTVGLSPDHMQRLSYKLTHMYYNWSGTVRVPAPCQYAHKLAFLIGQHVHSEADAKLEDVLYYL